MKTLKELNTIENNYFRQCGGYVTEGNWKQNTISRNKIRSFKSTHKNCFCGKINIYDDRGNIDNNPILTEYKKGMIFNFQYAFCVPVKDKELINLIKNYNREHVSYNSSVIMNEIDTIMKRIEELNGINLLWV
jgi:hypothetical protein